MPQGEDPSYRFGLRLAEVSRLWRHELDARLKPLGLSTARWVTLVNLSAHPEGMTQNALAIRVGIKGPSLVRQLDLLEADGWVERRDSPADRRVKRVFLTPKGEPVIETIAAIGRRLRAELMEGVDEREIRAAVALLDRMKLRLHALERREEAQALPEIETV
ncbi:MarR family transcriptional regulator [Desertibaculum subflavum]|uniref:MarR family transcriptional regulator n=1 Tax=Desertibaculum subflavum TaxID=2268458 RepID=UPI000E665887